MKRHLKTILIAPAFLYLLFVVVPAFVVCAIVNLVFPRPTAFIFDIILAPFLAWYRL